MCGWGGGALSYKVDTGGISSWAAWLQVIFSPSFCPGVDKFWVRAYVTFSCWFIWKARCNFVFNKVPVNPINMLLAISSALDSFWSVLGVSGSGVAPSLSRQPRVESWILPPPTFAKINVDASWPRASLAGFAGVVVRSSDGEFVAAARHSLCAPSATAAEAMALIHGCELGLSLRLISVIVETDSQETVSYLSRSISPGS